MQDLSLDLKHVPISHTSKASFDFFSKYSLSFPNNNNSKLFAAIDSNILTTIDLSTGCAVSCTDLKEEVQAFATNEKAHLFCMGYGSGEVVLYANENMESPVPLIHFKMPVRGLSISDNGQGLIACSEDSVANIALLSGDRTIIECLPGHEGSVKACSIHPTCLYAATTGCDGYLNVYKMLDQSRAELVKREKITEDKAAMVLSSPQKLQPSWSKDGKYLFIPGDYMFRYMEVEQWNIKTVPEMVQKAEIMLVESIDDEVSVIALKDASVSVWNLPKKTCVLNFEAQDNILEMKYRAEGRYLSVLTSTSVDIAVLPEAVFKTENQDVEMKNAEPEVEQNPNKDLALASSIVQMETEPQPDIKRKPQVSKLAAIIDAVPQESIQVNATQYDNSLRFLCWNSVGSITLLSRASSVSISFDFANKTSQRNFLIPDEYGISLASMCASGAILASSPDEENEDEKSKASTIQFIPFHEWRGIKGWTYELPKDELAKVVAIGSRWAAVYTSEYLIRIFTHEGLQKHLFSMETPVVTMCGFENLLAIIYHHSVPILGNQRMNLRLINVKDSFETVLDVPLPICTDSLLKWIGFSEEGQIFSYDTNGILRALMPYAGNSWVPVLDFKAGDPSKDLWIVSVSKNSVAGVELRGEYAEPKLSDKARVKEFKFKIPLLKNEAEDEGGNFEENYMLTSFDISQEKYRKDMWGKLKAHRKQQDPEYSQSLTIVTDEELNKAQKELDIILIDKVRQCCINNENEKAVSYAEMMHLTLSLSLVVKLCQKLHKNDVADKIEMILEERIIKEQSKKGKVVVSRSKGEAEKRPVQKTTPEPMITKIEEKSKQQIVREEKKTPRPEVEKKVEEPKIVEKHETPMISKNPFAKSVTDSGEKSKNVFGAFAEGNKQQKRSSNK